MYGILIILFSIIALSSCDNRGWVNIAQGTDPEGGSYILALDRSDITDYGSKKTAWARKSFSNPKKLKNGNSYQETYIFFAVNCRDKKYSIIEIGMSNPGSNDFVHTIKFSGSVEDINWLDVPEKKPSKKIYKELCTWYKSFI